MKKILLIEDDLQICKVIETYFRNKNTLIQAMYNGADALAIVKHELSDYELVLLDAMLPKTDGFTICRAIRKRIDTPVIFIIACGCEEDILNCRQRL